MLAFSCAISEIHFLALAGIRPDVHVQVFILFEERAGAELQLSVLQSFGFGLGANSGKSVVERQNLKKRLLSPTDLKGHAPRCRIRLLTKSTSAIGYLHNQRQARMQLICVVLRVGF